MHVGDTVLIHNVEDCIYGAADEMYRFEGKVAVITSTEDGYYIDIDKGRWHWCNNTLQLLIQPPEEDEIDSSDLI